MTEWGVVGVIVSLIGFAAAIVTPIIKLNTNITRLTVTLENISCDQTELQKNNTQAHERIWKKIDDDNIRISDHEKRIIKIEAKDK